MEIAKVTRQPCLENPRSEYESINAGETRHQAETLGKRCPDQNLLTHKTPVSNLIIVSNYDVKRVTR